MFEMFTIDTQGVNVQEIVASPILDDASPKEEKVFNATSTHEERLNHMRYLGMDRWWFPRPFSLLVRGTTLDGGRYEKRFTVTPDVDKVTLIEEGQSDGCAMGCWWHRR